MAIQLIIDGMEIPLTDDGSYNVKRGAVDNRNTTEAGTTVRQLIRSGVVQIDVKTTLADDELRALIIAQAAASVTVQYYDEEIDALSSDWTAFVDGLSYDLIVDVAGDYRLYNVSFSLVDLSTV